MYSSKISSLKNQYEELVSYCKINNEITFETYINDVYRKVLLLSAASYFESEIIEIIKSYVAIKSNNNIKIISLLENKTLLRQYHTFFDWHANNANQFFGLFGAEFKELAKKEIIKNHLEDAQSAFMSIGSERNNLVHNNFIEVNLNDTFDEIFKKYEQGCKFIEFIKILLNQ